MKKLVLISILFISIFIIPSANAVLTNGQDSLKSIYNKCYEKQMKDDFYYFDVDLNLNQADTDITFIDFTIIGNNLDKVTNSDETIFKISWTSDGKYEELNIKLEYFLENGKKVYYKVYTHQSEKFQIYFINNEFKVTVLGDYLENIQVYINSKEFYLYDSTLLRVRQLINPNNINYLYAFYSAHGSDFKNYDVEAPIIEVESDIYSEIGNPLSIENILKGIKITDAYCGDLTGTAEIVETNYNPKKIGTYDMKIKATDRFDNSSEASFKIHVIDIYGPTIDGINEYNVGIKKYITIEEIISNLEIKDNSNCDVTLDITDNYTPNKNKSGSYEIIVKAIDIGYNTTSFKITVNVTDDVEPTIKGKNITIYMSENKTIEDLKNFDYFDNETENKDLIVDYQTNFNSSKKGEYYIICNVTDKNLNQSSLKIYINNIDDVAPSFVVTNKISKTYLSKEELKNYFNTI